MKKVFQINLKSITKVFAVVMALSFVTFTGCKSYDQDIDALNTDLASLKTELTTLNNATKSALETQIAALNTEITALKGRVTTLEQTGATDAEVAAAIAAAKTEIMSKVVTLEAFNAYKATVTADLAALTTKVNAAATKAELAALQTAIDAKFVTIEGTLTALGAKVTALEGSVGDLNNKLNLLGTKVDDAIKRLDAKDKEIADLLATVNARLAIVEGILNVKDGKSLVIEDIKTQLADQLAKINANTAAIAKLITDLNAVDARLKALEALNIAKRLGDLEAKDIVLQAQIDAIKLEIQALKDKNAAQDLRMDGLESRIVALEKFKTDVLVPWMAAIDTWKTWADAEIKDLREEVIILNSNMKVMANAMHLNFETLSNRLTSITFIPEFFVNGIEAMNFSPLISECEPVTPGVVIAYHLNPSFITEADIEKDNMSFAVIKSENWMPYTYGESRAKAADAQVKANFVKIENGKIYVSVKVEDFALLTENISSNYSYTGFSEKFPMIALQIPLSEKAVKENALVFDENGAITVVNDTEYPADRVITGQYVRLYYTNLYAQSDVYLALDNAPVFTKLVQTVADAKLLTVKDIDGATATSPTVITLPYKGTIHLADTIAAIYDGMLFDVVKYGLKFKFDLLDESGVAISYVRNTVNQQTLIEILDAAKGTIKAKDVAESVIATSKGRTPIVRVTMYNDQDPTCAVLFAFVKVVFAEKPDITLGYEFKKGTATCASTDSIVPTSWTLTKIYNEVGMTSALFHDNYTGMQTLGEGTVTEVTATDGINKVLKWSIPASVVWAKLNANPTATEVTVTAQYKYTAANQFTNPDFIINLTHKFTRPYDEAMQNITVAELVKEYWYDMSGKNNGTVFEEVKHNVNVPFVGQTDPNAATFENNITQAFVQDADKSLAGYPNYQYFFLPTQPKHVDGTTNGTTLTVSADGQKLMSGAETVATINPFVANTGDILTLNKDSETAKRLLNYGAEFLRARIGIRYNFCPDLTDLTQAPVYANMAVKVAGKESFDVVFVRPINVTKDESQYFIDGKTFGQPNTYLEVRKTVALADWRNGVGYVSTFAQYPWYYQYYGVTNITVNTASIMTDLNQAAGVKVPVGNFPDLLVAYEPTITGVAPAAQYGYLTYRNNGNVIGTDFNLYVPVTITYTWGEIVSEQVVVPVKKTVGPSGVKAN